ncbi:MAG: sigma-54-dependent Fis family transcriptional regulator [Acidobacteria bacterium]|nr:sigma-54-dependent Fis family transcriptional regulator [Acidobacteriota bacterium]
MEPFKILVVDDETAMLKSCHKVLMQEGYAVDTTGNPVEALQLIRQRRYDLLIVDLKMPEMSGIELMALAHETQPDVPVLIITAYATLETALHAVSQGAFDYIPKPFSMSHLLCTVERCIHYRSVVARSGVPPAHTGDYREIIGESSPLLRALEVVRKVAALDVNVLIQGESGTGKELFARALHRNSGRSKGAFVPIDCASLPETLMESELFGYERGAFTGANSSKQGLLESANGGTAFFDEIGNLSPNIQSKLLRILQERKLRRLGALKLTGIDVRVVSASNRDLQSMVQEESFRKDLFYRLNVVLIHLPPLRDRKEDIPVLARRFLEEFRVKFCKPVETISSAALVALERYHWPGNVRELRNVIERAVSLGEGHQVSLLDLPPVLLDSDVTPILSGYERKSFQEAKREAVETFEKVYITRLLERTAGNVSQASRMANLPRTVFHRIMKKYGFFSRKFR